MSGRIVVVTGTGTEIGKTHLATALVLAWGRTAQVAGIKPVESGVTDVAETDAARLAAVSTCHVKHPPYRFAEPVSPHRAARAEGRVVDTGVWSAYVEDARAGAEGVVLELAGGLFSPVTDARSNADFVRCIADPFVLLVAPDRLGVLHDLAATTRAADAFGVHLGGIVLVTPAIPDASTSNAEDVPLVTDVPLLAVVPRATIDALAASVEVRRILEAATASGRNR